MTDRKDRKSIPYLRKRCFFDVTIGDKNVGRIVFELFDDICPKTCDNFRSLCTGEKGLGKTTGKPLHYKNVLFHRVVKGFIIQSGDFTMGNGRGGESIYGGTFNDENFKEKHEKPFLLSMANRGKNTNGSQFFITLVPTPHLDGVHVVFGRVLDGIEVIKEIQNIETGKDDKPVVDVVISNCGELVPQIKQKEKKKKHRKEKSKKSDGELSSDSEDREERDHKNKKKKEKKHKKHKNEKKIETKDKKAKLEELSVECSVRADEIPDIPENHLKRETPELEGREDRHSNRENYILRHTSGRKFKGRGEIRFKASSSRDFRRSETPPYWKRAESRLVPLKRIINRYKREENEEYDRNRVERSGSYGHRRDFNRSWDRDLSLRDRYRREGSDDENNSEPKRSRKRVYRESPSKRSVSPKENSSRRERNGNNNELNDDLNNKFIKSSETERHFIRSEVKVNVELNTKRIRRESSDDRQSSDEHKNDYPLDLTDIPLPNVPLPDPDDDNKRNRNERTYESKSEDRRKRSDSRERDYTSHKKVSSRQRRHSSDSQ